MILNLVFIIKKLSRRNIIWFLCNFESKYSKFRNTHVLKTGPAAPLGTLCGAPPNNKRENKNAHKKIITKKKIFLKCFEFIYFILLFLLLLLLFYYFFWNIFWSGQTSSYWSRVASIRNKRFYWIGLKNNTSS